MRCGRLVEASVPFVRFRVLRALDTGNLDDAEGKDRVLRGAARHFATLEPSVMREELVRIVANRMDLSQDMLASLLTHGASRRRARRPAAAQRPGAAPAERVRWIAASATERTFLALCIALPEPRRSRARRARPRGRPRDAGPAPRGRASARAPDDADRRARGRRRSSPRSSASWLFVPPAIERASPAQFGVERLQLALQRTEREIARARSQGEPVTELAGRRSQTQALIDRAMQLVMDEGADVALRQALGAAGRPRYPSPRHSGVAQSAEHSAVNRRVVGSSPTPRAEAQAGGRVLWGLRVADERDGVSGSGRRVAATEPAPR